MAKNKKSKALFEVLSKSEEASSSLAVPDWIKNKPVPADLDETPPPEPHAETWREAVDPEEPPPATDDLAEEYVAVDDEVEQPADTNAYETEPETHPSWAETVSLPPDPPAKQAKPAASPFSETSEPIFRIEGERVRLSLNYVSSMVALGGVLVLLVAAFVIGWLSAPKPQAATPPKLPDPGPNLRALDDKPIRSLPGRRDATRQYLMIETLRGSGNEDFDEADRILDFCRQNGVSAEMVFLDNRLAIWCLLGFQSAHSRAAAEFAEQVEALGTRYFETYGTYKFLQRRKEDAPLRPFYVTGKAEQKSEK